MLLIVDFLISPICKSCAIMSQKRGSKDKLKSKDDEAFKSDKNLEENAKVGIQLWRTLMFVAIKRFVFYFSHTQLNFHCLSVKHCETAHISKMSSRTSATLY